MRATAPLPAPSHVPEIGVHSPRVREALSPFGGSCRSFGSLEAGAEFSDRWQQPEGRHNR
jgi:hypothetical protein